LTEPRSFLLEPADLAPSLLARTQLLWINYPHNPTGAIAPLFQLLNSSRTEGIRRDGNDLLALFLVTGC
jgi:histidinol-phosphate/aromatic aminotransferase/cobyric acid decarboxylase-like protein